MLAQDYRSTYNNSAEREIRPETVANLRQAWKFRAEGPVAGAAAVVDGTVYIQSGNGTYALDAQTGQVLWRNADVSGTSSVTWSDGRLFINDRGAIVHSLDAATGQQLWQAEVDPHPVAAGWSSPVVFDRFVLLGSSSSEEATVAEGATFRGGVVAFDRDSGAELWRFYTEQPPFNGASVWSTVSIDVDERIVYGSTGNNYTEEAGPGSDSIFALDLDTGAKLWNTQLTEGDVFTILNPRSADTDFGTNPILFEAQVGGRTRKLVGAGQKSGVAWVLDRETGAVLWSHAVSPGSALIGGMLNSGAYDGERLIFAGNNGKSEAPGKENPRDGRETAVLMALDPATGNVVWERQVGQWVWAPITIANGVGFAGVDRELQAFDSRTGQKLFTYPTDGTITSAPVIVDGRVYFGSGLSYFVGTQDRTFHALALDAEGPQPTSTPAPTATPIPTVAGESFTAIYNEIFTPAGCASAFCHGGNQGNLSMTTRDEAYAQLVNQPAAGLLCATTELLRVDPGDPDGSLLIDKLAESRPVCGGTMPPGAMLPEAQIERVVRWILEGAANN